LVQSQAIDLIAIVLPSTAVFVVVNWQSSTTGGGGPSGAFMIVIAGGAPVATINANVGSYIQPMLAYLF
jgi:hypothetical protein